MKNCSTVLNKIKMFSKASGLKLFILFLLCWIFLSLFFIIKNNNPYVLHFFLTGIWPTASREWSWIVINSDFFDIQVQTRGFRDHLYLLECSWSLCFTVSFKTVKCQLTNHHQISYYIQGLNTFINTDKSSAIIMSNKGEAGQPWRMPLFFVG